MAWGSRIGADFAVLAGLDVIVGAAIRREDRGQAAGHGFEGGADQAFFQ